jgi:hypothetical protein
MENEQDKIYTDMQGDQYIYISKLGNKFYYKDRKMTILHRIGGPAVEWFDGDKEYWENGVEVKYEKH